MRTNPYLYPAVSLGLAALVGSTLPAVGQTAEHSGLLGKRYVEASAFILDYQNYEDDGYGLGVVVNLPVTAHLDVGAGFEPNWEEGDRDENFQDLFLYATLHTEFGDLRPFARAELGYEWWSVSDDPFYQVDVGAEYPLTDRVSVSASVGWSEFLSEDWNGGSFVASLRGNYWVTEAFAVSLTGSAMEGGTWGYGAAFVVTF